MAERMTDGRLEDIRITLAAREGVGLQTAEEMLAEIDRLRGKYEPTPAASLPVVGGGERVLATGTMRVTLATWLRYGPFWMEVYPPERVELIDVPLTRSEKAGQWWWGECFADRLEGAGVYGFKGTFAAKQDALDAMSAALIAWAESQVKAEG